MYYLAHMFLLTDISWLILHAFLSSVAFFLKKYMYIFSKNSFRNTIRVSNSLDLDQVWHFVGSDLVQSACKGDTSRWI